MSSSIDNAARKAPEARERILGAPETRRMKHMLGALVDELLLHDGWGRIEIDMKILSRRQKEVIIRSGKEYRFVMDFLNESTRIANPADCRERHSCPCGAREQE